MVVEMLIGGFTVIVVTTLVVAGVIAVTRERNGGNGDKQ